MFNIKVIKLKVQILAIAYVSVPTPPGKSWISSFKLAGPGKSWKITLVLESPGN